MHHVPNAVPHTITVAMREADSFRIDAVPVSYGLVMNLKTVQNILFYRDFHLGQNDQGPFYSIMNNVLLLCIFAGEGYVYRSRNHWS